MEMQDGAIGMQDGLLLVGGRPFVPRMVHFQGEPLELIANLGFNCVHLKEPPTSEQLEQASRHQLWIVCPPPAADDVSQKGIGRQYSRVLA